MTQIYTYVELFFDESRCFTDDQQAMYSFSISGVLLIYFITLPPRRTTQCQSQQLKDASSVDCSLSCPGSSSGVRLLERNQRNRSVCRLISYLETVSNRGICMRRSSAETATRGPAFVCVVYCASV